MKKLITLLSLPAFVLGLNSCTTVNTPKHAIEYNSFNGNITEYRGNHVIEYKTSFFNADPLVKKVVVDGKQYKTKEIVEEGRRIYSKLKTEFDSVRKSEDLKTMEILKE